MDTSSVSSKPPNQLPWLIIGILESKFFYFLFYKTFIFSWNNMELVELGSSTESSPMQNMGTPPPSGRVMRHCDPLNEVLLSQLTGRFTFILQPLSLSVAEVSICPHFFYTY